jgi:hypothetical protein
MITKNELLRLYPGDLVYHNSDPSSEWIVEAVARTQGDWDRPGSIYIQIQSRRGEYGRAGSLTLKFDYDASGVLILPGDLRRQEDLKGFDRSHPEKSPFREAYKDLLQCIECQERGCWECSKRGTDCRLVSEKIGLPKLGSVPHELLHHEESEDELWWIAGMSLKERRKKYILDCFNNSRWAPDDYIKSVKPFIIDSLNVGIIEGDYSSTTKVVGMERMLKELGKLWEE